MRDVIKALEALDVRMARLEELDARRATRMGPLPPSAHSEEVDATTMEAEERGAERFPNLVEHICSLHHAYRPHAPRCPLATRLPRPVSVAANLPLPTSATQESTVDDLLKGDEEGTSEQQHHHHSLREWAWVERLGAAGSPAPPSPTRAPSPSRAAMVEPVEEGDDGDERMYVAVAEQAKVRPEGDGAAPLRAYERLAQCCPHARDCPFAGAIGQGEAEAEQVVVEEEESALERIE
ncbi:hypothetical protein DMC30DRAFT_416274 [Rhodotorula diobovata]|uniref:Uncharacterized protein n=1 Tax=Rhodotorula diobovata TaxID=5288 RepID=A0A5C5FXT7_9BASI|nr:hypothetical protein DMC30DRAFT_416274 [Rhodotorula diobovata]